MAANSLSYEDSCSENAHLKSLCEPTDYEMCLQRGTNAPGKHASKTEAVTAQGEAYSYLFMNDHGSPSEDNVVYPITDTVEPQTQTPLQATCINE